MVNQTVKAKLHYVFDPLCGWCYAAAPLLHAAQQAGATIELHSGGMMSGEQRQRVTSTLRNYVIPHDQRIAKLTGQPFGAAYFDGLLCDEQAVFDSTPPTLAILAAQRLGVSGLTMLRRIQIAHYVEGLRIAEQDVLADLAFELGLDRVQFTQALLEQESQIDAHFAQTRRLMQQYGLRGFPSLLLENDGALQPFDLSRFFGKPEQFVVSLGSASLI